MRREVQLVFQDPFASLDPRLTVGFSVAEPIRTHRLLTGAAVEARVQELLEQVGLPGTMRGAIRTNCPAGSASACASPARWRAKPKVIIADEAVAALDVSIRAQVVNLLMELQAGWASPTCSSRTTWRWSSGSRHRVAVMYLGQVVEIGPRQAVFGDPQHPYTRRLLAAVPVPDPRAAIAA